MMIDMNRPTRGDESYPQASSRLRDEAADLLRQLDELPANTPPHKRQMLLNRLDVVLLEQERIDWQEQQRNGGW